MLASFWHLWWWWWWKHFNRKLTHAPHLIVHKNFVLMFLISLTSHILCFSGFWFTNILVLTFLQKNYFQIVIISARKTEFTFFDLRLFHFLALDRLISIVYVWSGLFVVGALDWLRFSTHHRNVFTQDIRSFERVSRLRPCSSSCWTSSCLIKKLILPVR